MWFHTPGLFLSASGGPFHLSGLNRADDQAHDVQVYADVSGGKVFISDLCDDDGTDVPLL